MNYKNICKFPIGVKALGKTVDPNEIVEIENSDETKRLVKENKLVQVADVKTASTSYEEQRSNRKTQKKSLEPRGHNNTKEEKLMEDD